MTDTSKQKVVCSTSKCGKPIYKVKAVSGYSPDVSLLAKATDTGNGYEIMFPTYTSVQDRHFIHLDYSEIEYVWNLYNKIKEDN